MAEARPIEAESRVMQCPNRIIKVMSLTAMSGSSFHSQRTLKTSCCSFNAIFAQSGIRNCTLAVANLLRMVFVHDQSVELCLLYELLGPLLQPLALDAEGFK